jgi:uncharacterized protein involved in outer membrane biogenesis
MNVKKYIWPSKRLHRLPIILVGVFILYTLLGFFLLPKIILNIATSAITEQLNRQTKIEQVKFNPYVFSCELTGLSIKGKTGQKNWLTVDRIMVNLQSASLFYQALVLSQIRIEQPRLSITRYPDQTYNFSDLLTGQTSSKPEETKKSNFRFSLNNIVLQAGEVDFIDQPMQTRHQISKINFSLPSLSNFPADVDTHVKPYFSAQVNNMTFEMDGRTKPFAKSKQTEFDLVLDDLSLPYYLSYLPGKRNFSLTRGKLSSNLTISYAQPAQRATYLRINGELNLNNLHISNNKATNKDHELCVIPGLKVKLSGGNLLAGELNMAKVHLKEPRINVVRLQNGTLSLPVLSKKAESPDKKEVSTGKRGKKPFSLSLAHFQLESGKVSFIDNSTSPSFTTTLESVQISLKGLQLGAASQSEFQFSTQTDNGGTLSVNGSLGLSPISLKAKAQLSDFLLTPYSPYYNPYFLGTIDSGHLNLAMDVSYKRADAGGMNLDNIDLFLENLSIRDTQGQKAVTVPEFALKKGRVGLSGQKITVGTIQIRQGDFRIKRNEDSSVNMVNLLAAGSSEQKANPDGNSTREKWNFSLNQFRIDECKTVFLDQTRSSPTRIAVSDISCRMNDLSTTQGERGSLKASMRIEENGQLNAEGDLGLSPLTVGIDIGLQDIDLTDFEPFVKDHVDLALQNGILETKGRFEIQASGQGDAPAVSFNGQAGILDLKISEPRQKTDLLSWNRLGLEGIEFENLQPAIRIKKVGLVGLNSQIIIYEEGGSNLQRMFKTKEKPERSPEKSPEKETKAVFAVEEFELSRGSLTFIDRKVSPSFQTSLDDLQGTIKNLSNQDERPLDISLQADLGTNAPLNLDGKASFLGQGLFTDLGVHLANIALSPLSPYSGRYIGYTIKKGKFNLAFKVQIKGEELECDSRLLLDQFTLGEKVDSPKAVNAPVKLGIALLKNRKGEIHINKTVSGDLSNPEFSIGDIVMKVFVNVLVKAATSPFSLLGSMFGGGEDINFVLFSTGQTSLSQQAMDKLKTLGKALYERPGLEVEVIGRADTSSDRASLHQKRFRNLLKRQKLLDMKDKGKSDIDLEDVRITEEESPTYLWQAYKEAPMEKPENILGLTKKLPPEEMEQRLKKSIVITENELRQLAINRAREVIGFLHQTGPVESERLFLHNPKLGQSQNDTFRKVEIRLH